MKSDTPRYIRFILNELHSIQKRIKQKLLPNRKRKKEEAPDPMEEILKLSKTLSNEKKKNRL
jgi:hypothetical protein